MKLLLLDNYDSFTYNLYHYLQDLCDDITVVRNDEITAEETDDFTHIVLSPGPGLPGEYGNMMGIISRQIDKKPILGICLGMQALALHFGGQLYNQKVVRHGVTTQIITAPQSVLYKNLPKKFTVGLYHSWAVEEAGLPSELVVTSKSKNGIVMALEHKTLPVMGVQFHPESIMTEHGHKILFNWLNIQT